MEEIDLKEFLKYLRKYIWIMLVAVVICLSAALVYDLSIKTPLYKSTTTVVLNKNDNSARGTVQEDLTTLNYNQKLVATYSELVKSNSVLGKVAEELSIEGGAAELKKQIKVGNIEDTEILTISVEDADAEKAAEIANKTADVFAAVIEDKYGQENVSQFDVAEVSFEQSNNTTLRDAAIAAFIGIFGVVAVAFLIFYFDDSVKYSKNLEKDLDMPVIGKIAHGDIDTKKNKNGQKSNNEILLVSMPKASTSESIRNLRANLSFSSVDKGLKSLLISSTNASEGKSFVSSNLATAYAQAGKNVLLIDGDLRKGRLHRIFKLRNARGFSDLLIDVKSKNYDKYFKETYIEGLTVITRGTCPPNPSELLGSARAKTVVKKLLGQFDMVIIDGAPSMGLSDSIVASKLVDGVVIVCRDGKTNRADLVAVVEDYKKIEAPFLGVVMNDIKRHSSGYGYYNYYEKDRSVADQKTMEGLSELNDAIEASREALIEQFRETGKKKPSKKSKYADEELSDLPTRAELKRMAKNKNTSHYHHAQEKNS